MLVALVGLLGACNRGPAAPVQQADAAPSASDGPVAARTAAVTDHHASATADWLPGTLSWDAWPIDVSRLGDGDRPAGRHGRVMVRGDHLVFADGTVARFWGTNVVARALFRGSREAIANQARRIAAAVPPPEATPDHL